MASKDNHVRMTLSKDRLVRPLVLTTRPTCLFLAAKTTNFPVPVDVFIKKFSKMSQADILDTEFLVAQSLGFEFWIRGPEKALRGWALELQAIPVDLTKMVAEAKKSAPDANSNAAQAALPKAIEHLVASRMTDLEFTHTPSQISLGAWYLSSEDLVMSYIDWRYTKRNGETMTEEQTDNLPFGSTKERLLEIVQDVAAVIKGSEVDLDMKKVKEVDKRLKGCTNPEKIPGTAL
jgi:cyclin H